MSGSIIICVPVRPDGQLDPRWGKAGQVAIARVESGAITGWEVFAVGWDALHDVGTEGGHHARVARFLMDHSVQVIVANHMGPPMEQMLHQMRLLVRLGAAGDARQAVLNATSSGELRPN